MKKTDSFYIYIITVFLVPVMLMLLCMSIISTSYVTLGEQVFFLKDNAVVNIAVLLIFTAVLALLSRIKALRGLFDKINGDKRLFMILKAGLLLLMFVISLIWVFSTRFTPFGDASWLHDAAENYRNGIFTDFENGWYNYIDLYPFQTRTLLLYVIIDSIFGGYRLMVYQVLNCLCTVLMLWSLQDIAGLSGATHSERLFVVLIGMLWPPVLLYNSFIYGNVPGLALILFSLAMWIRHFTSEKLVDISLFASVISAALAFCFKSNFLIFIIAMVIYGVFKTFSLDANGNRGLSFKTEVLRLMISLVGLAVFLLIIAIVPRKIATSVSGEPLNEGMATISWIEMGITESTAGPGWYTDDSKREYQAAEFKTEPMGKMCRENIKARLDHFKAHKDSAVSFFLRKTASQWNEPSMESFWILRGSEKENISPRLIDMTSYPGYVNAVSLLDLMHLMITAGCVIFILTFKRSEKSLEQLLLPMVFIGFFVFHFFWEAKSQYAYLAWVAMIPTVVMGYRDLAVRINTFVDEKTGKTSNTEKNKSREARPLTIIKLVMAALTLILLITLSVKGFTHDLTRDNVDFAEYMSENF